MAFKRKIRPSGNLAEFLGTTAALTPERFTKRLWEKLYATGSVRHLDGIRAHRAPRTIRRARARGERPVIG